jgi:protein-tyrosine phosphatase
VVEHAPIRICFVCSGNICRSPTAEVVLVDLARRTGRDHLIEVDSAGMGGWHVDDDMDRRSRQTLVDAGYEVPLHRAKQFTAADFATRDLVVALDSGHLDALLELAAATPDPQRSEAKVVLLRTSDPELGDGEAPDVPDPYYGEGDGFAIVLGQVERSCEALLESVEQSVGQQTERPPW